MSNKINTHKSSQQRLLIAFSLGIVYMLVAFIGGYVSGSLALFADAGHLLFHNGALLIALLASFIAAKQANEKYPQGFGRIETIGSYTNALLLLSISVFIAVEAIERLIAQGHQHEHVHNIDGSIMGMVAAAGLVLHIISAFVLHGGRRKSLNVYAVYLHVIFDVLATIVTLITGWIIYFFDIDWLDSAASLIIALIIFNSAIHLLRRSSRQLMGAVPDNINYKEVCKALSKIKHVTDVHDVVIYSTPDAGIALSAHIVLNESCLHSNHWNNCRKEAEKLLNEKFSITQCVLQIEASEEEHNH